MDHKSLENSKLKKTTKKTTTNQLLKRVNGNQSSQVVLVWFLLYRLTKDSQAPSHRILGLVMCHLGVLGNIPHNTSRNQLHGRWALGCVLWQCFSIGSCETVMLYVVKGHFFSFEGCVVLLEKKENIPAQDEVASNSGFKMTANICSKTFLKMYGLKYNLPWHRRV